MHAERADLKLSILTTNTDTCTPMHTHRETTTSKDKLCEKNTIFLQYGLYSHCLNVDIPLFHLFSGNSKNPSPTLYEQFKITTNKN